MTSPRSQLCLKAKLFNDLNLEVTFWILFYKIEEVEEDKEEADAASEDNKVN